MQTLISVEPFRDRFLRMRARGEITAIGLADELGWYRRPSPAMRRTGPVIPDAGRVHRTLGVTGQISRGGRYYRERVSYDMAARLCKALNLDPWEAGI